MKENKKINIIFTMLIIILGLFLCSIIKIHQLKQENILLKETYSGICDEEKIELVPCYLCNGVVKIQPVNDIFYIECAECELRTDFYSSKRDLITYWNRE